MKNLKEIRDFIPFVGTTQEFEWYSFINKWKKGIIIGINIKENKVLMESIPPSIDCWINIYWENRANPREYQIKIIDK